MKKISMQTSISSLRSALALGAIASISLAAGCPAPVEAEPKKKPPVEEPPDVTNIANVFPHDPLTDNQTPVEVTIAAPTTSDGTLTNDFVNALNCLQVPGGPTVFGFATVCLEDSTVTPDEDGSYRSVVPPTSFADAQDPFAQVQMYHHVNVIHDYFKNTFEFTGLDFPLNAVVNLSINVQGAWQSFENAAFIPEASFAAFGLPARDNGAIMFGQGASVDYAYDASVIYHEYTHAMIGPDRMNAIGAKSHGLDNTAGAMNEGLADYFASTVLEDGFLGRYALGTLGRDLESPRSCPADLTTEIHADGKIVGTALWAVRTALGAAVADELVFNAVQNATAETGLDELGELLRAEAVAAGVDDTVIPILTSHGMIDCERVKPWVAVNFAATAEQVPHQVEGKDNAQGGFADGMPGYHQWSVDVPAGKSVALSWSMNPPQGFGGGGALGPLHLAVRKDSAIDVAFSGAVTADGVVANTPLANNAQAVTLSGNCVPAAGGRIFLLFLNPNAAGQGVATMGISLVDAPAEGAVVNTCD